MQHLAAECLWQVRKSEQSEMTRCWDKYLPKHEMEAWVVWQWVGVVTRSIWIRLNLRFLQDIQVETFTGQLEMPGTQERA